MGDILVGETVDTWLDRLESEREAYVLTLPATWPDGRPNPYLRQCPTCGAQPGAYCSQYIDGVGFVAHSSRA